MLKSDLITSNNRRNRLKGFNIRYLNDNEKEIHRQRSGEIEGFEEQTPDYDWRLGLDVDDEIDAYST